ncbi:MAG: hypothetical protein U5K69_17550 [Balneolaceae bacterium]|nr:hypothetical protein [Balneolaceae bacterium]
MQDLFLRKQDLEVLTGPLNKEQFQLLESLRLQGQTAGTLDSLNLNLNMQGPAGSVALNGFTQLQGTF